MTMILVAAGFFIVGLLMVLKFRSVVSADDELERRWADAMHKRATRAGGPGAPAEPDDTGPSESPPRPDETSAGAAEPRAGED